MNDNDIDIQAGAPWMTVDDLVGVLPPINRVLYELRCVLHTELMFRERPLNGDDIDRVCARFIARDYAKHGK